jgi:hypothetical protein
MACETFLSFCANILELLSAEASLRVSIFVVANHTPSLASTVQYEDLRFGDLFGMRFGCDDGANVTLHVSCAR